MLKLFRLLSLLFIASTFCLVTACTSMKGGTTGGTDSLSDLKKLHSYSALSKPVKGINSIRYEAIKETALGVGARAGLTYRSKQLQDILTQNKRIMDMAFNFNSLMLSQNVVPPILEEANKSLKLDNDSTIRLSDKTYKIVTQSHFVTTSPNWRQYLWLDYSVPKKPHASLLPKNSKEQKVWDKEVTKGWNNGITQANIIFSENLARIVRDLKGMVLYRKLLAQHMVSQPYVGRSELGTTGNGTEVRFNDQILRITALPQLIPDSKTWQPVISK